MSSRETFATALGRKAQTVLVVDDQPAMREGLVRLLASARCTWGEIVAVGSLAEARAAAAQLVPDLVLLDVDLAGDDGLRLLPELMPHARVLVLTSHGDALTRERALRLGAVALVDKQEPAEHLLAQICRIAAPDLRGD